MRSPLTETIQRVQGMMEYVRENLSTDEYMLYLDLLAPQAEPVTKPKKARKKRSTKSARASSLQQQIQSRPRLDPTTAFKEPLCSICAGTEDYEDHQQSSPHYHEFQPPQKAAATGD